MLARIVPRLARNARIPVRALPALTRAAAPTPYVRPLSTSAPLAKKKKGSDKGEKAAEPPADVDGQLDLDVLNDKMNKTVAKCAENVQSLIGSLGRVDACT